MRVNRNFSLMELMIVLGLILFLAALTVPAVAPMLSNAHLKMGASAIKSSLDMARSIAIANGDVSRMIITFDPLGDRLQKDIPLLTGKPYEDGVKIIDVNGDGLAHYYQSDNYKWLKFYLVKEFGGPKDIAYLDLKTLDVDAGEVFGPFWMHRPIMQKDGSGIGSAQTFLAYNYVYKSSGETYYYRAVVNEDSFFEVPDADKKTWLAPLVLNADGRYESLLFTSHSADSFPYGTNTDSLSGLGAFWSLYIKSARLYEKRDMNHLVLQAGAEFATLRDAKALDDPRYDKENKKSTAFLSSLRGTNQLLGDDDEDGIVDEGMGVYAQRYNLNGDNMPIVLPMDIVAHPTTFNTYNYYFGAHEDVNVAATKEYKISGPDYSEEMLRRVWVMAAGEIEYTLVWKFDGIVDLNSNSGELKSLKWVLPYFMAVIFDAVENSISFQSTYGSAKIERILFQLSDFSAEKSLYVMYRLGQSWSGELKNVSVGSLSDVYKGEISQ